MNNWCTGSQGGAKKSRCTSFPRPLAVAAAAQTVATPPPSSSPTETSPVDCQGLRQGGGNRQLIIRAQVGKGVQNNRHAPPCLPSRRPSSRRPLVVQPSLPSPRPLASPRPLTSRHPYRRRAPHPFLRIAPRPRPLSVHQSQLRAERTVVVLTPSADGERGGGLPLFSIYEEEAKVVTEERSTKILFYFLI